LSYEELMFTSIGQKFPEAVHSQMFGKPCFKINGKAFICFFQEEMVFKLTGETHKEALGLKGAMLFDPSGKNRPMKEWVQVPSVHSGHWEAFATDALDYVISLKKG
jgi:hypothetical protein